ncbi:DUF4198 domain-containing protein [Motilimonas pumila]|uniref:DUF4198 domain-containing protein n=1 Tax=Motilimonas pumila TaxID=2303987 RepID=A0A418YEX7_9GAMM|nr:DUF4198 domain-containing protein [Motilimonas pumila]RJG47751.1 DUF4198 domain-containing protein [Motilimonas pumila]
MKTIFKRLSSLAFIISASACVLLPSMASAHPSWVLPSHFSVSKQEGDWITFDVTASHGTFVADKPASAEGTYVLMPDGRKERPAYTVKGKRRSVFDFFFVEQGTHKVVADNPAMYLTTFKSGRRDAVKRIRANKSDRAQMLPKDAKDVVSMKYQRRAETYITVNAPSEKALAPSNKGFEALPVTLPGDMVEGEPVVFKYLFNGQPASGLEVEIRREGTLYRNQQEEVILTANEQGEIRFTPKAAGRYLSIAVHSDKVENDPLADQHRTMLNITFEVQLN